MVRRDSFLSGTAMTESIEARLAQAVERAKDVVITQTRYLDRRPDISVALARYGDLRAAQGRWEEHICAPGLVICGEICPLEAEIEALLKRGGN